LFRQFFSLGRISHWHLEPRWLRFGGNNRGRNGNRDEDPSDNSGIHLQNLFDKTAPVVGIGPQNCHAICARQNAINAQSLSVRGNSLGHVRSDSMKTTLLLNDEPETTRLMLKEVAFAVSAARDGEGRAGCNCDRWGHPCSGCVERNIRTQAETPIHHQSQQET
jgi:hypothetical protein